MITIKTYTKSFAEDTFKLFCGTLYNINSKDYSKAQLDVWADQNRSLTEWHNHLSNIYTLLSFSDDILVGFGSIDPTGYVDMMYVHHKYQGMGIATAILNALEQSDTYTNYTVYCSITAKPFFESQGYTTIKKNTVLRKGISLTNYLMRKDNHNE